VAGASTQADREGTASGIVLTIVFMAGLISAPPPVLANGLDSIAVLIIYTVGIMDLAMIAG
jgi:hypothetical protein